MRSASAAAASAGRVCGVRSPRWVAGVAHLEQLDGPLDVGQAAAARA